MEKRGAFVFVTLSVLSFFLLLSIAFASAADIYSQECQLTVSLLSQNPYPAVPGEYVKVVFQMGGTENCESIYFDVVPKFPFSKDYSNASTRFNIMGRNYVRDYQTYALAAYRLLVDKDALEGENALTAEYGTTGATPASYLQDFDINVEDVRTDFEVIIQDYDAAKQTITFGVVNVGESSAEALVLTVPKQTNLDVKGTNNIVIGSLDSNDDTTASIQAVPKVGEILIQLSYNDANTVRRTIEKTVMFDKGYLETTKNTPTGTSTTTYILLLVIIAAVAYFFYRRHKNKQAKNGKISLLRNR